MRGSTHPPTETFPPSSGKVLGVVGIAVAALVAVLALSGDPGVGGVRVALGAALAGLVVWVVLLRPRVLVRGPLLLLRGMVRDAQVPLSLVDRVRVSQTLHIWVDDVRLTCPAIGRSTRALIRDQRNAARLGMEHHQEQSYADMVESRLSDLAATARRDHRGPAGSLERSLAVPELVAALVLLALVVGLGWL